MGIVGVQNHKFNSLPCRLNWVLLGTSWVPTTRSLFRISSLSCILVPFLSLSAANRISWRSKCHPSHDPTGGGYRIAGEAAT